MHKEDDKVNRLISKSREGTDTGIVRGTERKSASEKKGVGVRIGLIWLSIRYSNMSWRQAFEGANFIA